MIQKIRLFLNFLIFKTIIQLNIISIKFFPILKIRNYKKFLIKLWQDLFKGNKKKYLQLDVLIIIIIKCLKKDLSDI